MGFYLYKNLKKPMVFFGLRGKYIYWALGAIVISLILVIIMNTIMGMLGTLIGLGLAGISLWTVFMLQDKKGLYNRTRNKNEVHVFPKRFKSVKKE